MANRYFVAALPASGRVDLPEETAHHLARVLRCRVGDAIRLGDGRGATASAVVAHVGKSAVACDVQMLAHEEPPALRLALAFAVPRLQRVDWLLEHGTEVGVTTFQPIWTSRTRPVHEKPERWQRIVTAAAGQCDRAWLPEVAPACSLDELLARSPEAELRLLADAAGAPPPAFATGPAILLVGPEGGFADAERAAIAAAGYRSVRFARHILRTETAALVGAAILLAH